MEQEVTKDIGVFARLGWNDGKTESFAFTAIDRLATAGVSSPARAGIGPTIPSPLNSPPADSPASTRLSAGAATIS